MVRLVGAGTLTILLASAGANAQDNSAAEQATHAITPAERVSWVADEAFSPGSLTMGLFDAGLMTATNWPREWHRSPSGFARRVGDDRATDIIASGVEAGVGALWHEDPRYARVGGRHIGRRLRHVFTNVALAPRPDGHLTPAWGRFTGLVVGNVVENSWLPPSARTGGVMTVRILDGLLDRLAGNAWDEFWPDVRAHVLHHR
jgi:hypothetical protein